MEESSKASFKKIYFSLRCVFVAALGLSLVTVSGLLVAVVSLFAEHRLYSVHGLQQLWHTDLVAPWHVGFSRSRD